MEISERDVQVSGGGCHSIQRNNRVSLAPC